MDFKEQLQVFQSRMDSALDKMVPYDCGTPERLAKAMRHSLFAGGKRIRPVLLLGVFEMNPSTLDPLPAAVALECIHTYSLIHDDLPSMDDSPLRRGHPTCHVVFDDATAILAGDALLTMAFEILASEYSKTPEVAAGLITELSRAAGPSGMVGGQMEDVMLEQSSSSFDAKTIEQIEDKKTGALLTASLRMGCILSAYDMTVLSAADRLGRVIGRSYQIVDDILDATSDEATLGKAVKIDEKNAKITAVDQFGLEGARNQVEVLIREGLQVLESWGGDTEFLENLLLYLQTRIS